MNQFEQDYNEWKSYIPHFRRVFLMRRFICFLAYTLETVSVFLSAMALKSLFVNEEKSQNLLIPLSSREIKVCICLSLFSHHLWVALNVERTFSTAAEFRAMMIMKLQSKLIDWSGRTSNGVPFLSNGGIIPLRWWWLFSPEGSFRLPYREAPTIGIVHNLEESGRISAFVMQSIDGGIQLRLRGSHELMEIGQVFDGGGYRNVILVDPY